MSRMVRAVLYGMMSLSVTIFTFMAMAEPVYSLMTSFDSVVAGLGIASLTTFWTPTTNIIKTSYWLTGVLIIIGQLVWLYLYAQKREYVTAGGVYAR